MSTTKPFVALLATLLLFVSLPATAEDLTTISEEQLLSILSEEGYVASKSEHLVLETKIDSIITFPDY